MSWNKRRRIGTRYVYTRERTEWLEISVPAIISREVFEAAQQQSQRNTRFSPRNRKHEYLFVGGRLRCGRCGASMTAYSSKDTPRYRCSSQFRHHPNEPFCRGGVRADKLEPTVWREIERRLNDPTLITAELERLSQQEVATTEDMTKELQALQKELAALEREAQRWDAAYAGEVITLAELKAKKLDIAERKQRLLTQQATTQTTLKTTQQHHAEMQEILAYCQRVRNKLNTLDMPRKRLALEALDIAVTWRPGEPIQVEGHLFGNTASMMTP
jgi:site-specific DNA recombinase